MANKNRSLYSFSGISRKHLTYDERCLYESRYILKAKKGDPDALAWIEKESRPQRRYFAFKLLGKNVNSTQVDDFLSVGFHDGMRTALEKFDLKYNVSLFDYSNEPILKSMTRFKYGCDTVVRPVWLRDKLSTVYSDILSEGDEITQETVWKKLASKVSKKTLYVSHLKISCFNSLEPGENPQAPCSFKSYETAEENLFVKNIISELPTNERLCVEYKLNLTNEKNPPFSKEKFRYYYQSGIRKLQRSLSLIRN